jgi:hypothetical protein
MYDRNRIMLYREKCSLSDVLRTHVRSNSAVMLEQLEYALMHLQLPLCTRGLIVISHRSSVVLVYACSPMALLTRASTIQVSSPLDERGLAWDQKLPAYRNRKLQLHESVAGCQKRAFTSEECVWPVSLCAGFVEPCRRTSQS